MRLHPLRYVLKALSEAPSSLGLTFGQRPLRLARSHAVYLKYKEGDAIPLPLESGSPLA
jgi:hypothetical protein